MGAVVVVGGGVVGSAVTSALARGGTATLLLEAEDGLALGASGTNSGILHTGFDSTPGELETRLILRAARLRAAMPEELGVEVLRCGATLTPRDAGEREAAAALAANARRNGVEAALGADGSLRVPGESVTDPVAFVHALAADACRHGARVRTGARVEAITSRDGGIVVVVSGGEEVRAAALINCAGLFADEVAALAGDALPAIYPRKGEFLVFEPPAGERLEGILLPLPSPAGKGVLVFPTLDGHVVAGPTAREREDKRDWSVEGDAEELIFDRARWMWPPLERARRIGAYAGLRPAGRGANYVIERSRTMPGVVHVAAIRSTGLSASLAIGEHVAAMVRGLGVALPRTDGVARDLPSDDGAGGRWWERAARLRGGSEDA
ncbi:MAG TPA: FAD-dependent oxidoreductase [Solirubrobacteraceae bacterium]|jgi:glycerol-3-phosphate dehydrogenase|nr:FAD-dependent oxidoreductase [Solirubrobacteraceae bacterium]